MNRFTRIAIVVLASIGFTAAASGATVTYAQPAPVWVPSHWEWNGTSNVWVGGYYAQGQAAPVAQQPAAQPLWLPAHWESTASGQVYVAGKWVEAAPEQQPAAPQQQPAPAPQVVYAQQPAPTQQVVYAQQPAPQVVYVQQPAAQTVYVERDPYYSSPSWGVSIGLPLFLGGWGRGFGCVPFHGGGHWSGGVSVGFRGR